MRSTVFSAGSVPTTALRALTYELIPGGVEPLTMTDASCAVSVLLAAHAACSTSELRPFHCDAHTKGS
jgi:hypothetical protein